MPDQHPPVPTNLEQQHKLAKDLLRDAQWMGDVELVEAILERGRVAVESRDPVHLGTPLGWAAFGSVHRRARGGDYSAVVDRLVVAGADINAPANGEPISLIAMPEGNPEVTGDVAEARRRLMRVPLSARKVCRRH